MKPASINEMPENIPVPRRGITANLNHATVSFSAAAGVASGAFVLKRLVLIFSLLSTGALKGFASKPCALRSYRDSRSSTHTETGVTTMSAIYRIVWWSDMKHCIGVNEIVDGARVTLQ